VKAKKEFCGDRTFFSLVTENKIHPIAGVFIAAYRLIL